MRSIDGGVDGIRQMINQFYQAVPTSWAGGFRHDRHAVSPHRNIQLKSG